MKKRNMIVFSLVMAVVILVGVGCGSKDPKVILEEAVMNSAKIKTSEQKVELNLSLDVENADPMIAGYLQMFENISMEMAMKSDTENMRTAGEITVDLAGMAYTVELYTTPELVAFQFPGALQYVVQEIEEDMQMDTEEKQEMLNLVQDITKAMLDSTKDDKIVNNGKQTIQTPEGEIKVTEIAIELSDEETKEMLKEVVKIMLDNPQMRGYFVEGFKSASAEYEGVELTDEAIEEKIEEVKGELDTAFDEMDKILEINDLKTKYFIDDKNNIVKTDFEVSIAIEDEESGQNMTLDLQGTTDIWNINKDIEIEIPEFDENNSINMEDFINTMFGVGF